MSWHAEDWSKWLPFFQVLAFSNAFLDWKILCFNSNSTKVAWRVTSHYMNHRCHWDTDITSAQCVHSGSVNCLPGYRSPVCVAFDRTAATPPRQGWFVLPHSHYCDIIMGAVASQITSLTIVYSTVYSDADQRKHQSSASLAFVRGIHRGPVNSPHKWPVTRKNVSILWRHHEGNSAALDL